MGDSLQNIQEIAKLLISVGFGQFEPDIRRRIAAGTPVNQMVYYLDLKKMGIDITDCKKALTQIEQKSATFKFYLFDDVCGSPGDRPGGQNALSGTSGSVCKKLVSPENKPIKPGQYSVVLDHGGIMAILAPSIDTENDTDEAMDPSVDETQSESMIVSADEPQSETKVDAKKSFSFVEECRNPDCTGDKKENEVFCDTCKGIRYCSKECMEAFAKNHTKHCADWKKGAKLYTSVRQVSRLFAETLAEQIIASVLTYSGENEVLPSDCVVYFQLKKRKADITNTFAFLQECKCMNLGYRIVDKNDHAQLKSQDKLAGKSNVFRIMFSYESTISVEYTCEFAK